MRSETFDEWVRGRTCESCAIFKKDVFCFLLGWSQEDDIERSDVSNFYLVHHLSGQTEDFGVKFRGDSRRRISVNQLAGELVMVARGGNVLLHNSQGGRSEKMLSREQIIDTRAIRFIGDHFYLAGGIRRVLRRDGPEQWTDMSKDVPHELRPGVNSLSLGFHDIDGFDESDIYAAGGHGDVWRFDGSTWLPVDIPTNREIASVCCASDGAVYLGGIGHLIVRGRGDEWAIINQDESNRVFQQIVNYDGRVLAVDEWGSTIFEITSDGVAPMDTGDFSLPPTSCLCMAVGHGMLLTAGLESASVFDGRVWRSLFRSSETEEVVLAQRMLDETASALDKLRDDREKLEHDDGQ